MQSLRVADAAHQVLKARVRAKIVDPQVSFEHWPPLRGGCMSLKLFQRASVHGVAQLKSEAQHGPTAKAVFFLTGAFLPDFEHGSGIGDCVYGGGCCPEKDDGPTPLGRLSSFRRPGRAALNLT